MKLSAIRRLISTCIEIVYVWNSRVGNVAENFLKTRFLEYKATDGRFFHLVLRVI